jgi:2-C-methyl-D-erythritol 2,4-cyclodiphosphate synthase
MEPDNMSLRIGLGYDIHRLEEGYSLILGGVKIPFHKGLAGYSDADVLIHALIDAMLGAIACGDIGTHFPPGDEKFKNIDSTLLLKQTNNILLDKGYKISNIDTTVIAEKPKLAPYIQDMRQKLAEVLQIDTDKISIKAKTNEGCDYTGQEHAIASHAIVLLETI